MLITVYGATGYQGKLTLTELSRHDVEVRLVGRDRTRLECAAADVGIPHADRRVAGLDDRAALVAALAGSDVVINCAGPFTTSGAVMVDATIAAGAHYVDTAGEQLYVKDVFDFLGGDAERAGVTVVPAVNDGCLPGDLLAHLIAERTGSLAEITVSHFINGAAGLSRGSLRSAAATMDAMRSGGLTYEHGAWHSGVPARHDRITLPDGRSVAMAALPTCEVVTIPRHVQVDHVESLLEATLKAGLETPITEEMIAGLPAGPTEHDRADQQFTYLLDAVDHQGQRTRGVIRGRDTYGTTAVAAVEAARRLAAGDTAAGVLAPAQAFDPADFLETLSDRDLTWTLAVN
ncbi:saccharopine dehydrogenase NADP-binding domain-containing protein [Nocardia otitidiscaviarum]|uniref:saccharopine dehydrogenase family protein n=1 Tax=Nocardia otitidiscaviarum TaxID=1823 RepID=UPI0004A73AA8|nr:saccharopine dehydrogenase NADP-binding domain-containing protein [Nocardia otitidiscaviarum]MBF6132169.1 saccharopine dehydrogenase NADP-binding domain-containing protein [Nocardia otitidiscaviarum]MBF6483299.1 saccharopine dehydrogenase NADP-binding domain-containing protein [Nocardia otitidiscaviarum]